MEDRQKLQALLNECRLDLVRLEKELEEAKYWQALPQTIRPIEDNIETLKEQIQELEEYLK